MSGLRKLADAFLGPSASEIVEKLRDKLNIKQSGGESDARRIARIRYEISAESYNLDQLVGRNLADLDEPECIEALHLTRSIYRALKEYRALRRHDV